MSDPRQKDFDERHTRLPTVTALTKREYFAVMAMQGLNCTFSNTEQFPPNIDNIKYIVALSVAQADELIKQLEK